MRKEGGGVAGVPGQTSRNMKPGESSLGFVTSPGVRHRKGEVDTLPAEVRRVADLTLVGGWQPARLGCDVACREDIPAPTRAQEGLVTTRPWQPAFGKGLVERATHSSGLALG